MVSKIFDLSEHEIEVSTSVEPPIGCDRGVYLRAEDLPAEYGFDIDIAHADEFVLAPHDTDERLMFARWNTDVDVSDMRSDGFREARTINGPDRLDGYANVKSFELIDRRE